MIATQQGTSVNWRYENPLTGSRGGSTSDGKYSAQAEFDPTGVDVGLAEPQINSSSGGEQPTDGLFNLVPEVLSGRCKVDYVSVPCTMMMNLLAMGTAAPCPNNDCGPPTIKGRITPVVVDPVTGGYGLHEWVAEDGEMLTDDRNKGDVVVVNKNEDAKGHWEYVSAPMKSFYTPTAPQRRSHASIRRTSPQNSQQSVMAFDRKEGVSSHMAQYIVTFDLLVEH